MLKRLKPKEILDIADNNGFDWFEEINSPDYIMDDVIGFEINVDCAKEYSLADLATNKSFLEALFKASKKTNSDYIAFIISALNHDLIYSKGKNFWEICSEFIGKKNV